MSWKKTLLLLGIFMALLAAPLILISNPMIDVYQERCNANPKTEFNRWLELRICGGLAYKTMRPEKSVIAYKKFMENFPDDPEYSYAWLRYAMSLEDCDRNKEAEEQYVAIMEAYEERHEHAVIHAEAKRGMMRVRYQKK